MVQFRTEIPTEKVPIGGLAVMAFWRSPHGPLGSGPPSAGYLQEEIGKKREKREKERKK